ncbi:hypothetical protein PWG71_00720 [Nocardiopsis sp. N85]|nr:hypothetical protein [Nocardiopsis sp. N85]
MGVSHAGPHPKTENLNSLGSSSGNNQLSTGLNAEVHQAERSSEGNIVSITWSVKNSGSERVVLAWLSDRTYTYSGPNFAGVTALNQEHATRYHPIMDSTGACLCSGKTSNDFSQRVEPGDQVAYWSLFSIPDGVEELTIEIPNFEPIEDIPVS